MKEYNRIQKIASVFEKIGYFFMAAIFIWIIASFVNVNMHNLTDMQYAAWNLFNLF